MPVNWNADIAINCVDATLLFCCFCVNLWEYRTKRYAHVLTLAILSLYSTFSVLFMGLSDMWESIPLAQLAGMFGGPMLISWVFLVDRMTRDAVDPVKIFACGAVLMGYTILNLNPANFMKDPNGQLGIILTGDLTTYGVALGILLPVLILYYGVRINYYAPHSLKRFTRFLLIAAIIYGIIYPGIIISRLDKTLSIPGLLGTVVLSGTLLFTIGTVREPRVAFILPFRVLRLTVIDTTTGITLFTHTWAAGKRLADVDIFSGMLHGISGLLNEAVQAGELQEIKLGNATLILQRSGNAPIACVLTTTKSSKVLRQALYRFTTQFAMKFAKQLANPAEVSQFDPASALVSETFPFVPEFS